MTSLVVATVLSTYLKGEGNNALTILLITSSLLSMSYLYKYGYLRFFGIPHNFIQAGIPVLFGKLKRIIIGMFALYFLLELFDNKAKQYFKDMGVSKDESLLTNLKSIYHSGLNDLFTVVVALFIVAIILAIILTYQIEYKELSFLLIVIITGSLLFFSIGLMYYFLSFAIINLMGVVWAYVAGLYDAKKKDEFHTFDKEKLIIDYYNGKAIVGKLGSDKKIDGIITVYDTGSKEINFGEKINYKK
jgi:hypothetical protein